LNTLIQSPAFAGYRVSIVTTCGKSKLRRALTVSLFVLAILGLWTFTAATSRSAAVLRQYDTSVFAANVFVTYVAILACYVSLSPRRWKQRTKNAILNVVTIVIMFTLVELPAVLGWFDYRRLFAPDKMLGGTGPHNKIVEPQLYHHRPSYDRFSSAEPGDSVVMLGVGSKKLYEAEYIYDRYGFRNDRDLEQAPVVLLGDSFIEGYKVTQSKIVSTRLSQRLGVDVSNLAQCGYGPDSQLAVLQLLALDLSPSIVVWFFCEENDLYNYEAAKRGWDDYVREFNSFKARSFLQNFLLCTNLQAKCLYRRMTNRAVQYSATLLTPDSDSGATMYFLHRPSPMTKMKLTRLKEYRHILLEARSVCDQNNITLLLVHIPMKFRCYHNLVSFPEASNVSRWALNDVPERIGQLCEASGVHYLDLTPVLSEAAEKGSLVYFLDDAHWTEAGHQVAAQRIAEFISGNGWLENDSSSPDGSPDPVRRQSKIERGE
jgi:hypothetical protein